MPAALAPSPSPARQRRKQARPQELLDAALELFVEKGFAATRTEEVAQRAGVSKGTLYLYYASKEELFKAAIVHHLSARIAASAQEVAQWRGTMGALLESSLVAWWQQTYASPVAGAFKIVVSEAGNFPEIARFYADEVIAPGHALIGGIVERGIASGEFRRLDVASVVHSLLFPLVMLCVHKHGLAACTHEPVDGHRFIAEHVALVVRGLRASPPATLESRVSRSARRP